MGADREGLEARRMPGRPHQSLPGHHQKFPGNKKLSAVQPSWTIMCAMLATSYWMFLVLDESVTCRQSPKSDAKSQNAKGNLKTTKSSWAKSHWYPVDLQSVGGCLPTWECQSCLYLVHCSLVGHVWFPNPLGSWGTWPSRACLGHGTVSATSCSCVDHSLINPSVLLSLCVLPEPGRLNTCVGRFSNGQSWQMSMLQFQGQVEDSDRLCKAKVISQSLSMERSF